jgi:antagonist of KipI
VITSPHTTATGGAAIEVTHAPPFLTVQDLGRPGWRASGVPPGGAMDPWALQAANLLLGNPAGAAALEWAEGGGALRFRQGASIVLAGALADVRLDGAELAPWCVHPAPAGSVLEVGRFLQGRFLYLAVGGGVDVPPVLGSRSTYLPAHLGGVDGRRLRTGDVVAGGAAERGGPGAGIGLPAALRPPLTDDAPLRLIAGPQRAALSDAHWHALLRTPWRVSASADRMGYRLDGAAVGEAVTDASLPSQPTCPGAVQLPPGGTPIVLMADAPTVGGYATPAVVCTADVSVLAQHRPGDVVTFSEIGVEEARALLRERQRWLEEVRAAVTAFPTLARRPADGSLLRDDS